MAGSRIKGITIEIDGNTTKLNETKNGFHPTRKRVGFSP